MEIEQFTWEIVDSNSWLITEGSHGLLIDVVDNEEMYEKVVSLDDLIIILTHSHFDHIIGLNHIRALQSNTTVMATALCSKYLGSIYRNLSSSATAFMKFYEGGKKGDIEIEPFTCESADKTFVDETSFDWNDHRVMLKAVHGHTADGLIVVLDEKLMFSGDTLLPIPTITRFPSGNSKKFWLEDIPMLWSLKPTMSVYPGHGEVGTLVDMLAVNKIPEGIRSVWNYQSTVLM